MRQSAHAGRDPAHTVIVSGEDLVAGQGAPIHVARAHIHYAVCRVLDAVYNNEALRRHGANSLCHRLYINCHARDRTGLNDGSNTCIRVDLSQVILCSHQCLVFLMGNVDVFLACDGTPLAACAGRSRMLQGAANHVAALRRSHDCRTDQAKEHLGTTLSGKHHAIINAKECFHVLARGSDDAHQFTRGGVITALVIGNG